MSRICFKAEEKGEEGRATTKTSLPDHMLVTLGLSATLFASLVLFIFGIFTIKGPFTMETSGMTIAEELCKFRAKVQAS